MLEAQEVFLAAVWHIAFQDPRCERHVGNVSFSTLQGQLIGIIERGVPQAYVRARASSATLCSVRVSGVFFCILFILKRESEMYQNGLGYISDTYPNRYPPVTVPPL